MGRRVAIATSLLSQMFAALSLDQAVEGVVRVVVARLNTLVAEVDLLLGVFPDVGDVPGWVVRVVQVLHLAAGPASHGSAGLATRTAQEPAPYRTGGDRQC